ncbi:hypothetical protein D3C87_1666490 [compost metagenome]
MPVVVSAWLPFSTTFHSEPTFISRRHSKVSPAFWLPNDAEKENEAPEVAVTTIFCASAIVTV